MRQERPGQMVEGFECNFCTVDKMKPLMSSSLEMYENENSDLRSLIPCRAPL